MDDEKRKGVVTLTWKDSFKPKELDAVLSRIERDLPKHFQKKKTAKRYLCEATNFIEMFIRESKRYPLDFKVIGEKLIVYQFMFKPGRITEDDVKKCLRFRPNDLYAIVDVFQDWDEWDRITTSDNLLGWIELYLSYMWIDNEACNYIAEIIGVDADSEDVKDMFYEVIEDKEWFRKSLPKLYIFDKLIEKRINRTIKKFIAAGDFIYGD
jgi:hypothetical protein